MSKTKQHRDNLTPGAESTVSKGRMIEAIVASMHESSGVNVERNVKLPPIGSQGPKREIDVLLSSEVCGYPVRWAVECKNEKKRIGAPYIDAFVGKLQDVGIPPSYGIFVTTSDYSKGAIEQAKKIGMRLLIIKNALRDLEPTIQQAVQATIFLLPIVNGFEVQNFAFNPMMSLAEAAMLFNKHGEAVSSIPYVIWRAWIDGNIQASIGKCGVEIETTEELYQKVGEQLVRVIKIVVQVSIVGLVQQFIGDASLHHLHNVTNNTLERQQLKAHFDPPAPGRYPLKIIETEEQLEQEIHKPTIVALYNRIRLPRINLWNVSYWPPSERVVKIITEKMQAFEAGFTPDPRPFNIAELEGTDLAAVFEPISQSFLVNQTKS